jgi:hypothetical protein
MHNGRIPPELPTFTFSGSGITVHLRKVAPLLLAQVKKSIPAPVPPMNTVNFGDGPVQQANPADPDYQQALVDHEQRVNEKIMEVLFSLGVDISDEGGRVAPALESVERLRMQMREFGVELHPDDKLVYILNICLVDTDDIARLRDAIMRKSQPTEDAINETLQTFQGDVSGS